MEERFKILDFKPTENPPWRDGLSYQDTPLISEMLSDIKQYMNIHQTNITNGNIDASVHKKAVKKLLISFFMHVQNEEEIGVCDRGKTEHLMNFAERVNIKSSDSDVSNIRDIQKSASNVNETVELMGCMVKDKDCSDQVVRKCGRSSSLEETVEQLYEESNSLPEKSELETLNLCQAYLLIKHEVEMSDPDCIGYIELETLIQEVHKTAMKNIVEEAGKFCVNKRITKFKGELHEYPQFASQEIAEVALMTLLDNYQSEMHRIKNNPHGLDLELLFKCASWFLYAFLTLHPFCDGNGRVARLLTSYSLLTFCPFMSPVYNVFSTTCEGDYIKALISTRKFGPKLNADVKSKEDAQSLVLSILEHKPSDLCSMLIESNWAMWRQLLKEVDCRDDRLYEWEVDRSY